METKRSLLNQFKICLVDFWGEKVTKSSIKQAWCDYLYTVEETEEVPNEYYKLKKDELAELYKVAGL